MKNNFIELTNTDDQNVFVNILNILWIEPSDDNETMISLNINGKNDFPYILYVKENYHTIKNMIIS